MRLRQSTFWRVLQVLLLLAMAAGALSLVWLDARGAAIMRSDEWAAFLAVSFFFCGVLLAWLVFVRMTPSPRPPRVLSRAGRRRGRGLCPRCGYDVRWAFERGCPECGWKRSAAATRSYN